MLENLPETQSSQNTVSPVAPAMPRSAVPESAAPQPVTTPTPEPIQPIVPPTQQPGFQGPEPVNAPVISDTSQMETPKTNWKLYGLVGVLVLVFVTLGGFSIYNEFVLSQQPIAIDGPLVPENPVSVLQSPSPQEDFNTPNNMIPPEGVTNVIPSPSPQAKPKATYTNYQHSFTFEYEENVAYQDISCTAPTQTRPTSEEKLIFIDTTDVTSNDELTAFCDSSNTQHKAKIMVSESPIECLGDSKVRSVGGVVEAVQCSGKTTSSSSLESSTSLLIPKDGKTIIIEINAPDHLKLLNNAIETFSFDVGNEPEITES